MSLAAILFFGLGSIACILTGIGVLGWQVYYWLDRGEWYSISLLDALSWTNPANRWLLAPDRWVGLWKIFRFLPFSITSIAAGCFLFAKLILSDSGPTRSKTPRTPS